MVMIDLGDEKKSLGVISVTCATKTSLIRLLPRCRKHASDEVRVRLLTTYPISSRYNDVQGNESVTSWSRCAAVGVSLADAGIRAGMPEPDIRVSCPLGCWLLRAPTGALGGRFSDRVDGRGRLLGVT